MTICDADLDQENPRLMKDSSGGCFVVWDDVRTENHPFGDIYMQHLDTAGNTTFENNGMVISAEAFAQTHPLVRVTDEDKIFVSWGDGQTGSIGIKVSVYNEDGSVVSGAEDVTVYYGLSGDALNYKLLSNGDYPIIFWEDTRFSSVANRVFYQIVNPDGSFARDDNGQAFTDETGFNQENISAVFNTNSNTLAAVWEENRGEDKRIFAQALNSETGSSLWDDGGLQLSTESTSQTIAKISNEGDNYYVGWSDYNMDFMDPVNEIVGQKIVDGDLEWGVNGKLIVDLEGDDILEDLVGRYYIWRNNTWPDDNIYVKLVDEDGNTAPGWSEDGLLVCGATNNQSNAKGVMTEEGLLVIWTDNRSGVSSDIYSQLITEDGNILWDADGISIVDFDQDQTNPVFIYSEVSSEIVVAWEDFRNANKDIFVQKFSPTQSSGGAGIWQSNGVEAVVKAGEQSSIGLAENDGKFLISWADYSGGAYSDLFIQNVDENGNILLNSDGLIICDEIRNQYDPTIVTGAGNSNFIFWVDNRSSGKTDIYNLFAQKVNPSGLSIDDNNYQLSVINYQLGQNYPNPFNPITKINYELQITNYELAEIVVYNSAGQMVWSSPVTRYGSPVTDFVLFDGSRFNSGVYYYSIIVDGKQLSTKKMVMIK